jgi:glycylpeptide N-tetradecanoyltransferase
MPPGYRRDWHPAVRVKATSKLVAFISAIPAKVQAYETEVPMVEINYLCIHKKLRSKRLAPVLIKEITRRVNLTDVWQATYTAGALLPKPIARNRYYHRSLNPKKLIEVGFSQLPRRMTLKMTLRLYQLDSETSTSHLRPLTKADIPSARNLLLKYVSKFKLFVHFSDDDFSHWFLPRVNVVYSYVVCDPATGEVTDMISFYCLPSTILNNAQHNSLRAAFSFYNVATSVPWHVLIRDALILARQNGFDVFNALNVMVRIGLSL